MNGKISNLSQIAYVRRYTLTEGKENGLKVVEVNNGKLRFLLNESKALDVMQLWHNGTNISFMSKNGFTAREIPFINRFEGGMVYSCGFDNIGFREGYELHGRLHNTPAKLLQAEIIGEDIIVKAQIEFTALFGENLILIRTVKTKIGEDTFSLSDTVSNESEKPQDYCLLYHVNLGYPMIDKGVSVLTDCKNPVGRDAWATENIKTYQTVADDIPCDSERCYFLQNDKPIATVINKKLKKQFTLEYSKKSLPCFVQWNSFATNDYAVGLEPATTFLDDKFKYSKLAPHKKQNFNLTITVCDIK